jgi:hypothetical protein
VLGQRAKNCQQRKNNIDRITTLDKLYGNLSVSTDTSEPRGDFGAIRSQSSTELRSIPEWNLSTDHDVFAVAYKQHKVFYNFQQNNLSNNAYYDKFNTRVTVAKAIGIRWADVSCLQWVINNVEQFKTAHKGTDYKDLDKDT